jgi:hypothetical protein
MPSFAANLEKTLHAALTDAGERPAASTWPSLPRW